MGTIPEPLRSELKGAERPFDAERRRRFATLLQKCEMNLEKYCSQPSIGENAWHPPEHLFLKTLDIDFHHVGAWAIVLIAGDDSNGARTIVRLTDEAMTSVSGLDVKFDKAGVDTIAQGHIDQSRPNAFVPQYLIACRFRFERDHLARRTDALDELSSIEANVGTDVPDNVAPSNRTE